MNLKKVFGIISWLPDQELDRSQRIARLNRLLKQIEELFPSVDILIIAQNWKDYSIPNIANKVIVKEYPCLGILGARKVLRQEFLKTSYDYIIMADDDMIIQIFTQDAPNNYLAQMDKHPCGFCFISYKAAQLNLCAISRYIYRKEEMVDIDPYKGEGYEDTIYSNLLHYKYPSHEFSIQNITHTQFNNTIESAPSTWSYRYANNWRRLSYATAYIVSALKHHQYDIDQLKNEIDQTYKDVPAKPNRGYLLKSPALAKQIERIKKEEK